MAVFFKTPAPPGVSRAGVRDSVIVRAEGLFEHRQLVRRRGPLACLWAKDRDGRLASRWSDPTSSDPAREPRRLAVAR